MERISCGLLRVKVLINKAGNALAAWCTGSTLALAEQSPSELFSVRVVQA